MPKRNKTFTVPLLGAHLSVAGGFHQALLTAEKLGCNCVQIFLKNQRQWTAPDLDGAMIEKWMETRNRLPQIQQVIGHSGYLINLAGDNAKIRELSFRSLRDELYRCDALGIDRLVLHPGSHRGQGVKTGIKLVSEALNRLLSIYTDVTILLENTAGAGNCLGGNIEELAELMERSKFPARLGCCLDTCHLFASGYTLYPKFCYNKVLKEIDTRIGIRKIGCFHFNDSVEPWDLIWTAMNTSAGEK